MPAAGMITRSMKAKRHSDARNSHESPSMTCSGQREMGQRYTYRVRVSAAAERALLADWDRCRWVWNHCVAASKTASRVREKCGRALLDRRLTGWRAEHAWLSAGASVHAPMVPPRRYSWRIPKRSR